MYQRRLTVWLFLILLLNGFGGWAESDLGAQETNQDGWQMLTEAVSHRGDVEIRMGEFKYKLSIVDPPPTQDAINEIVAAHFGALKSSNQTGGETEESLRASVAKQMKQNANRRSKYTFVLGETYQYVELLKYNRESSSYQHRLEMLRRILSRRNDSGIVFDHQNRMLMVASGSSHVGSQNPNRLGRAVGLLAMMAGQKGKTLDQNLRAYIGQVEVKKLEDPVELETFELTCALLKPVANVTSIKLQVVPSRGNITPLYQELSQNGTVVREWKCSNYFQPNDQELWFPKACTFRRTNPIPTFEAYTFAEDGVSLNKEIPKDRFCIMVSARQTLFDGRDPSDQKSYRATQDLQLSVGDLDELEDNKSWDRR